MNSICIFVTQNKLKQDFDIRELSGKAIQKVVFELVSIGDVTSTGRTLSLHSNFASKRSYLNDLVYKENLVCYAPIAWFENYPVPEKSLQLKPIKINYGCHPASFESLSIQLDSDGSLSAGLNFFAIWKIIVTPV